VFMTPNTPETQAKALSMLVDIIMEAITESGSRGIPEGHLYAALMSIPNFRVDHLNLILEALEKKGKITRRGFLVKAVR